MFKVLVFLAFDILFIKSAVIIWNETSGQLNGYLILCVALAVWFTWELINAIKQW